MKISYLKDPIETLKYLDLNSQVDQVYCRRSRVKRSMHRLAKNVSEKDTYAICMLKTYYKIKLKEDVKTRFTNMFVLPFMINSTVKVYNGKSYIPILLKDFMSGRYLGEFIKTRNTGAHSARGISTDKIKR